MRLSKKLLSVISTLLVLAFVLTACQSVPGSDIDTSNLTSEQMEMLEDYLESSEQSEESASSSTEEEESTVDFNEMYMEEDPNEPISDEDYLPEELLPVQETTTQAVLPSGREWVKYILDVAEYQRAYPDLQAAFGDNLDAYVDHYLSTGLYEGRDQGKLFDPWDYAEAYPDVKEECGDDANKIIEHYVTFGINENRTAGTTQGYEDFADKISRESMVGKVVEKAPVSRLDALIAHADNALTYGRNQEGATYPQLIVDGINPINKTAPKWDVMKQVPSNLYAQNNLLKMLEGLTWITGDEKYKDAAYEQIQMRYDTPGLKDSSGLWYTGGHCFVDVITGDLNYAWHETKDYQLPLELYYRVDPEGFKEYVTAFWNAHVYDFSSLIVNRHGTYNTPLQNGGDIWSVEYTNPDPFVVSDKIPFVSTCNDMIEMAVYLSEVTGDPKYKAWGDRLLDKLIGVTDTETGITGPQYGVLYDESTGDLEDRWLVNFAGADFVDNRGTDYKTLTPQDFKLAGENKKIERNTSKSVMGYGPQVYTQLYEMTGDQKYYDFAKGNMLGFVRYMYDKERHLLNGYMLTNGTDLNPGMGNGPVLIAPRGGYYSPAGAALVETETVWDGQFESLIDVCYMLKPEEMSEKQELWDAVRAWGRSEGMGDLGTFMGQNANVNLQTTCNKPMLCVGIISLYKYTGNQQYYDLAVRIADNIVNNYYDAEAGMFCTYANAPYTVFSGEHVYAVFCVEAMTQGLLDQISLDLSHGGFDNVHSQYGQRPDGEMFYKRSAVKVEKVDLGTSQYSLILDELPNTDIFDISGYAQEHAIRQMVALGVMTVDENSNFAPDAMITRGELVEVVVELFGFENATVPSDFRFTDVDGKPYYEAVVKAYNAGILDENMCGSLFDGEKIVSREELASVIVRALKVATPNTTYRASNALYRVQDADAISAWAREYCDIATNHRLMLDVEDVEFQPKAEVTRAMAAEVMQDALRYYDVKGLQKLSATVSPFDADFPEVTWESSDTTILEIDHKGNLYPLKSGSVIVTATADGVYSQIEVIIAQKQDWMIKEIIVGGEPLDKFSPDILNYNVNLYLGTTVAPEITATSISGASVEVRLPATLPGTAELNVQGSDVIYKIELDNTLIEYTVNEDFNHKIGTYLKDMESDTYTWFVNGTSEQYYPYWKIIPKNWVHPDYEGYGCLSFPYRHELGTSEGRAIINISDTTKHSMGVGANDMLVVAELEIAFKNLKGHEYGYSIYFNEAQAQGTKGVARFDINEHNVIMRQQTDGTSYQPTARVLNDEEFYTLRIVADKKTRTYDWYINDELIEKNVAPRHLNVTGLGTIRMHVKKCSEYDADPKAEMFVDNVKVYELQRHVAAERFDQDPSPTNPPASPTPEPTPTIDPDSIPTEITYVIDENWDGFAADTKVAGTTGTNYDWEFIGEDYDETVKVVSKSSFATGAAANDNCVMFPYTHTSGAAAKLYMRLDPDKWIALGKSHPGYAVIEADIAIGGTGSVTRYNVHVNQGRATDKSTSSVSRIYVQGNSSFIYGAPETTTVDMERDKFYHVKWIVDRASRTYTYMVDGQVMLTDKNVLHSGVWILVRSMLASPRNPTTWIPSCTWIMLKFIQPIRIPHPHRSPHLNPHRLLQRHPH